MVAVSSGAPEAVAKRYHKASHRVKHATTGQYPRGGEDPDPNAVSETIALASLANTHAPTTKADYFLSDEQWELVSPLLPTQKPGQGRPRRDDRQVTRRDTL